MNQNQYRPPFQPQPQPRPSVIQNSNPPIEDIVKMLATNTLQFQQETRSSIQNLEKQMSQLETSMGKLEAQGLGKLPSQTIINPRDNTSKISLRSGKELEGPVQKSSKVTPKDTVEPKADNNKTIEHPPEEQSKSQSNISTDCIPLPFPNRRNRSKKEELEKELLETFQKVKVNIPLLDAIRQVPRYAKFLKELCTSKRKLKGNEILSVGENASAII